MVYGLGSNSFGSLELGHNVVVKSPQIIGELCYKNIKQFFNGYNFVLALTHDNCLYSWGRNARGQLGTLCAFIKDDPYVEPELIDLEFILTSDGCVYGWGDNRYGQIGSGHNFENKEIIYCGDCCSFAITSEGQVFSWGPNEWYQLGHNSTDNIWEPQLIADLTGIKTICSAGGLTYFLSIDGFIRFCDRYSNENNEDFIQKSPKRTNSGQHDYVDQYKRLFDEKRQIGDGSYGKVFEVTNKLKNCYAVKKIDIQDDNYTKDCEKEVERLIKSLQNILQHKRQVFGRQPGEPMNSIEFYISCHIFKEILECVQYLHELNPPIIHRDIHTGNILLSKTVRNGRYFKVADFGLATIRKSNSKASNPTREAPEVRRGESNDPKSDVYSLAITTEEIFGFDLEDILENSSQKYSLDNEVLNKCVVQLKQVLKEMLNRDDPTFRPSCRQY
ncbi:unnamed protein product [Oppiella nova]|uniref:Protein kinase domain-containing protein n=1 Tax=Oppiella nova TaxID=334625 RepID=A0A7R9LAJ9_9ACAR|nr:unnamed protein product [Oppiella nova]CAG2161621.1 unnamed protein product [Oppiella nova]